jgi:2-polyprenyl-3-methyl-5-hydroxy-6-metoxy-1,4-benzoquinol methylase
MSEIVQSCPLCKSERSRLFDSRSFRGKPVVNRVCQDCGLVFQSPRMTAAESEDFYAEEYRLLNEGSIDPTARNTATQRARAESLLAFTQPVLKKVSRHLDVGCSIGILLKRFANKFHCEPVGIEPGEVHRNLAHKDGLTTYASLEELEKAGEGHFDLISMSHVLEHLPDPVGYLVHLRETLLEPTGWLLIEVPNLYSHDSFETAHLISYSNHSLRQTLEQAGFEIVRLEKHGRPRSGWLPLYITLLAVPRSGSTGSLYLHPERGVAIKRRVGMLRRRILERFFSRWVWRTMEG